MQNKICVYNNKLFLTLDAYLVAYSYEKYSKSEEEKFLECFKIKLPVKNAYQSDIRLEVINNCVTELKSLVIFIFEIGEECRVFIYSSEFIKKLYRLTSPKRGTLVERNSDNLFISDGPTYAFRLNNTFHLYSVPHSINTSFEFQSISCGTEKCKIVQFKCFGALENTRQLLFLLVTVSNISGQQSIKITGFVSEKVERLHEWENIPVRFFFPLCYGNVLKAVHVLKAVPSLKSQPLKLKEWDSTACVICTKDECLIFVDAVLKYCCKLTLPLLAVMRMNVEPSNIFLEDANIVLTFENKTVYFISTARNKCEVLKCWSDIEASLVGEIVTEGLKQVLLLKETGVDSWQRNCVLYDMSSFVPINIQSHSAMPSLRGTLSGLEKKVEVVKSAIQNIEHEISQKSAASMDALSKLNGVKLNSESLKQKKTFQESLVDLILSKDENKWEDAPSESKPCVRFLSERQRVVDNRWIVSLRFINDGERSICNPSIKALMQGQQVACVQRVFLSRSADAFPLSQPIDSKAEFFAVLSLDYSAAHLDEDLFLVLSWYHGILAELDNDLFVADSKRVLSQSQLCIRVGLGPTQDSLPTDIRTPEDLLFTRAVQQRVTLGIRSLHSDIGRMEEWLTKNDPRCSNLSVVAPSTKCWVFDHKSLLRGVQLVFRNLGGHLAEIEAFIRNEKEICLLVNYLYKVLPEDIIICPLLFSKSQLLDARKNAAMSMKQEIDTITTSLQVHNIARRNSTQLLLPHTVGSTVLSKATYGRIRATLVKRECITDAKFRNFS